MKRNIHKSLGLLFLFLLAFGCLSSVPKNQLKFGIEAAQKGLWDEAIFRWEKAVQSDPNSAAAHNNLAVAYEKKGLFDKAEEEYKKALQISPKDEQIQTNYQRFKRKAKKNDKDEKKNEKK